MHNFSLVETPKTPKPNLISEHYSKYICNIDDGLRKKRRLRKSNFKLTENIENSGIMLRRRKTLNSKKMMY